MNNASPSGPSWQGSGFSLTGSLPNISAAAVSFPAGAVGGEGVSPTLSALTRCTCPDAIARPDFDCPLHGLNGTLTQNSQSITHT